MYMAPERTESGVGYLGIEWIGGGGGRDDSLQTADDCGGRRGWIYPGAVGRRTGAGRRVASRFYTSVPLLTRGRHSAPQAGGQAGIPMVGSRIGR